MRIDEDNIRRKSKSLTCGFKGVVPKLGAGKKRPSDYFRAVVGVFLTAAFVAGTLILLWNLLSVGRSLSNGKAQQKAEYIQVIFKPKTK